MSQHIKKTVIHMITFHISLPDTSRSLIMAIGSNRWIFLTVYNGPNPKGCEKYELDVL